MADQGMFLSQQQRLQMVLAPQLRQSLEMLQLPILELRTLIQQEIEQNPTLEEVPDKKEADSIEIEPGGKETEDRSEMDFTEEFKALAKLDDEWRDYFFQNLASRPHSPVDDEKRQFFLDSLPQRESLQEHLLNQLELAGLSEPDREIGELLIGSINEDGYLTTTPEELSETAALDLERVMAVLDIIHEFDPTGVGARDLRDCLMLQLERQGQVESLACRIVDSQLDRLAGHKLQDIAKAMKVTPEEVQAAAAIIGRLDPKPGRAYSTEVSTYIYPEVVVQKIEGSYVVIQNDDNLPHVRISKLYRKLMKSEDATKDVKNYIVERVRSGVFMIKSIQQRQQTIFKIASEIVKVQTEFLDNGVAHLKPLTMSQVADEVGVHETTVSRAVNAKYMQTPNGVYEMKYFFTPGLKTQNGADVSNETVKDMIAHLVANEDASSPLSDQGIVKKLNDDGIKIARRTVAKYRLVLRIPPSHMRKSY